MRMKILTAARREQRGERNQSLTHKTKVAKICVLP
jgi:hypothetical protein